MDRHSIRAKVDVSKVLKTLIYAGGAKYEQDVYGLMDDWLEANESVSVKEKVMTFHIHMEASSDTEDFCFSTFPISSEVAAAEAELFIVDKGKDLRLKLAFDGPV